MRCGPAGTSPVNSGVADGDVPASVKLSTLPVTAKAFTPSIRTVCDIGPLVAPAGVYRCTGAHAAVGGAVHDTHDEQTSVTGVPT